MAEKNIFMKLNDVRLKFMQAPINKSGKNKFAGFKYYELNDIIPTALQLLSDEKLCFVVSFEENQANGLLIDAESEKTVMFTTALTELDVRAKGMNSAQARGAIETYARRRLWSSLLELTDGEVVDNISVGDKNVQETNKVADTKEKAEPKADKPTNEQTISTREEYTLASEDDVNRVKEKLKEMKVAGGNPNYIKNVLQELHKTELSKEYCDMVIIDIDNKLKEL